MIIDSKELNTFNFNKCLVAHMVVRVGVVGYGTIGKRVADAILRQDDMKLIGIAVRRADWRSMLAIERGINVYTSTDADLKSFSEKKLEVSGNIEDLLNSVDVIVDATPEGVGEKNKVLYEKHNVKAVFEGGEDHELTGVSFVATRNYSESVGKQFTRVVSCNTTAISRVVGGIHEKIGLKKARVAIYRRAADPWESHSKGIMNTVVPELKIPSHHGPDVQTVIHDLDIITIAAKGSHNLFHLHVGFLEAHNNITRNDVIRVLEEEPRVVLVRGSDGIVALNSIFELGRDLGRPRGDLYEIPVWEESVKVNGNEIYLIWATPNESNVVPDNIDAIRALTKIETDGKKSVEKTDKALNILKKFY
jgi:glyceraldehyde-3-phosphate dehydrogenase (NAD(P))